MEFRGLTLDPFQQQAIEHVDADRSVLVALVLAHLVLEALQYRFA